MLLNVSITHVQLYINVFSETVGLFPSTRSPETYLKGEELRFKSCLTTFRHKLLRNSEPAQYVPEPAKRAVRHVKTVSLKSALRYEFL